MDLKILFMLLIYYSVLSLVFLTGASYFNGYSNPISLNSSSVSADELDRGGLFGTGISFIRFTSLITVGVGLPDDTPLWFQILFSSWQVILLIFTIGWLINSIWSG
jgi:hypothetical protein